MFTSNNMKLRYALCPVCWLFASVAVADVTIETKAFCLTVGDDAVARSLVVKETGEECLDQSARLPLFASTQIRPFNNQTRLVQQAKRTIYPANRLRRVGDRLFVKFETAPYEVVMRVVESEAGYAAFKVEEMISNTVDEHQYCQWKMDVPPVESFRLLQLPVKNRKNFGEWLNVMWDEKAVVSVMAGTPYVEADNEVREGFHRLSVESHRDYGVTNGVAVLAVAPAREAFLDQVDCIECDYDLPRGVQSRRDNRLNASIYWTMHLTPETLDEHIAYAKKGGFRMMLLYFRGLVKGGRGDGYGNLPDYAWEDCWTTESFTEAIRRLHAEGISVGLHTLQTFIGLNSSYVTPEADHRLALVRHFTLARHLPLSEESCDVYVEENPVSAPMHPKCRVLKFGTELLEYAGYVTERPYRFTGVKRRHCGTYAKAHPLGEIGGVLGISECAGTSAYVAQSTSLQDEIAEKIAKIYDCGLDFLYFDGSEDVEPPCLVNIALSQWRCARKCGKPPLFTEGCAKTHFGWHLQSGGNAFDVFPPEIFKEKIVEYPCEAAVRLAKDFTRVDFGWWRFGLPKFEGEVQKEGVWNIHKARTVGVQPDIWEYGTSKAAAYDCPATMWMWLDSVRKHKRTDDILETVRKWEDVRARQLLTAEQKELLKDPTREFHLLDDGKGGYEMVEWRQLAVAGGKWTAVRAFVYERGGRRVVVYWHIADKAKLVLPDGLPTLEVENMKSWETDLSATDLVDAFARARIVDHSKVIGYQLDISRCKVPTMATLRRMVDLLALLGYNQFQLYTEHTFAYSQHEDVWREASPMTPEEIRELDGYCAARGIELVPNQNSFGHLEQWLRHSGYNDLAEMPAGGSVYKRWGNYVSKCPLALCPTDPRSVDFLAGLYDELFPCFRSKYVNVGCDETLELWDAEGKGRSQAAIQEKGAARVYFDFLLKIHKLCTERGHRMMFWGDIILHSPELIPELPQDVICLNWGYEANHPFAQQTAAFKAAKRDFIVCPGTSAWGSLSGRINNMMANVDSAVTNGLQNGMAGLLLADWGDGGHPNPWVTSVPAIVYAAHRLRGEQLTRDQLAAELDKVLGCKCGRALLAYGDIYEKVGGRMGNSTELYLLLKQGKDYQRAEGVTDETLAAALQQWKYAKSLLDLDGAPQWVREDFAVLDLLYRAVEIRIKEPNRKNFRALFEPEYRRLWLRQNRIGGLAASLTALFGAQ